MSNRRKSHLKFCLSDVDISPNPNPFNFWTVEYEHIKKIGIRLHFFSKLKKSVKFVALKPNAFNFLL